MGLYRIPSMAIKVLEASVAEKIAAGEVIQRPASVVKELVENSIDAGAGRISVEIERAGKSLIRVTDDGRGIPRDELALAFEHHATSKVASIDDLARIDTMGFRGEALPSIATVSEIVMVSRSAGGELGGRVEISFGREMGIKDAGAPVGTTVEVRNLFGNLPARSKFLKSDRTEWGRVASIVTDAALVFPGIAFNLARDGETAVNTESHPDILSRIRALFSPSIADSLVPVSAKVGGVGIEGWVGRPDLTRSNMKMVHVYVNRRHVRVPAVTHALKAAFSEYIPKGKCPVAFLFITVPPGTVDVNVHPAKEEIRFRDTSPVHNAVRQAVGRTLTGTAAARPVGTILRGAERRRYNGKIDWQRPLRPVAEKEFGYPAGPARVTPVDVRQYEEERRFLQVHDTYIVVEDEQGVMLVDQHALHERVLLEELKEKFRSRSVEKQNLLIPANVDLAPDEMARLEDIKDGLDDLGLEVEPFGGNTVVVRAVPAFLGKADPAELLLEILENMNPAADRESRMRELIALMACKGAVKAGDRLPGEQIRALLERSKGVDFSGACAHGRPTRILLSMSEIEKMFKRR